MSNAQEKAAPARGHDVINAELLAGEILKSRPADVGRRHSDSGLVIAQALHINRFRQRLPQGPIVQ
jgi:hypothetical protein